MSTHTSPEPEAPKGPSLKRFKPHQLAIGLGIFMGVFTVASGIIPQFTHWHNENHPSREVFEGIPGALQVAFYTVIPMLLIWGAFAFSQRMRTVRLSLFEGERSGHRAERMENAGSVPALPVVDDSVGAHSRIGWHLPPDVRS